VRRVSVRAQDPGHLPRRQKKSVGRDPRPPVLKPGQATRSRMGARPPPRCLLDRMSTTWTQGKGSFNFLSALHLALTRLAALHPDLGLRRRAGDLDLAATQLVARVRIHTSASARFPKKPADRARSASMAGPPRFRAGPRQTGNRPVNAKTAFSPRSTTGPGADRKFKLRFPWVR